MLDAAKKEELIAAGFVPTTYPGQDGEFLSKRCRVETMPYAHAHVEDNDFVFGTMVAVTEILPCGHLVQMSIGDADYLEGPLPVVSEEGQALIRDAMAGVALSR